MRAAAFWARVDRSEGPDACWPWTGSRGSKGYGSFRYDGRNQGTHRVAYQLATGPIPAGFLVCHSCDIRPCCNPAHLFLGTIADNNADMHAKGRYRGPRGETAGTSKLRVEDVLAIRASDGFIREIAVAFGVSPSQVQRIRSRERWAWLP